MSRMHWGVKGAKHSVSKESKHLEKRKIADMSRGDIYHWNLF